MSLRFGLGVFTGQLPLDGSRSAAVEYAELLELAELAEAVGFDSVWTSEHHFAGDSWLPSQLPLLAAIAARTSRLKLATGVVVAPLHHPLRLAEDAAVVDQISGGRLILGLGVGYRTEEFRSFGVSFDERTARLVETVEILRLAWSGERFSFKGRFHELDRVRVTPTPAHPIPIWLGAGVPAAIRRAGRLGDGFLAMPCPPEELRAQVALAEEGAAERGNKAGSFPSGVVLFAWLGPVDGHVLRSVWHHENVVVAWRGGEDSPEWPLRLPPAADELPARLLRGEPEQVVEALAPYAALAEDRDLTLVVRLHYPGLSVRRVGPAIERFGAEVIPALTR